MSLYKEKLGGGGLTPPKIHFKTSKAMDGVNFFDSVTDPDYDFSFLEVYVNDELTNIPANALTANAGDDIRIVSLSKPSEPYPFFYPSNGRDYIASIEEPLPFMGETDFGGYFHNCRSLASIPKNLFINNPQITNFQSCFDYCEALTSVPQGLFDNHPNVENFNYCFFGCTSLTSIPQGLFDNNPIVYDFSYCFFGCTSLTSIPQGLFDNKPYVIMFNSCFFGCTSLTSIPQGLFDNNPVVYDFSYCFKDCENLKVNVQIGSIYDGIVRVDSFAENTAGKGTVYCRAGSYAYNSFLEDTSANVNVLTY